MKFVTLGGVPCQGVARAAEAEQWLALRTAQLSCVGGDLLSRWGIG